MKQRPQYRRACLSLVDRLLAEVRVDPTQVSRLYAALAVSSVFVLPGQAANPDLSPPSLSIATFLHDGKESVLVATSAGRIPARIMSMQVPFMPLVSAARKYPLVLNPDDKRPFVISPAAMESLLAGHIPEVDDLGQVPETATLSAKVVALFLQRLCTAFSREPAVSRAFLMQEFGEVAERDIHLTVCVDAPAEEDARITDIVLATAGGTDGLHVPVDVVSTTEPEYAEICEQQGPFYVRGAAPDRITLQ